MVGGAARRPPPQLLASSRRPQRRCSLLVRSSRLFFLFVARTRKKRQSPRRKRAIVSFSASNHCNCAQCDSTISPQLISGREIFLFLKIGMLNYSFSQIDGRFEIKNFVFTHLFDRNSLLGNHKYSNFVLICSKNKEASNFLTLIKQDFINFEYLGLFN